MESELKEFRRRVNAGAHSRASGGDDTPIAEDAVSETSTIPQKREEDDLEKGQASNAPTTPAPHSPRMPVATKTETDPLARQRSVVSSGAEFESDPYTYVGLKGWRSYRLLRPGRGMYHDVKRRLPFYWSDWTEAFTYRTLVGTLRIYFVNLLPAIAFTLDMYRQTGNFYGLNEGLLASALAGLVFSLFSAQPLTIVGVTGLISLFNYTIYDIVKIYDVTIYPQFMVWVSIFAAIFHWLTAIFNICDYMRFVTDFSSETFGMYVGIIYMIKGIEELVDDFTRGTTNGFMAVMVAAMYFVGVYGLEKIGVGTRFNPTIRGMIGDYAYPIVTIFCVGFVHIPGNLKDTNITKLPITKSFQPTQDRDWLIKDFWQLDAKWICASIPFGFLLTLLFYYDHNVSSLTAQAKQYPLKKPGGFHWDFFLLGMTCFFGGLIGLPLPNGLVPQAPIHTDSLCDYQTDLQLIKTEDIEGEEIRRPKVSIKKVHEQRMSHLIMGLLILGTMSRPLLVVLGTMPRAVFAGVFVSVGWGSIEGNGITHKLMHIIGEGRFLPPDDPLYKIPKKRIGFYIFLQLFFALVCVAISQTLGAVAFPVIITALIPIRWIYISKCFTVKELDAMDALTADNPVVLASFGGRPESNGGMSSVMSGDAGKGREYRARHGGVERQRGGSFHR